MLKAAHAAVVAYPISQDPSWLSPMNAREGLLHSLVLLDDVPLRLGALIMSHLDERIPRR